MADFPDIVRALVDGLPDLLNGQTVDISGAPTLLDGITSGTGTKASLDTDAAKGFIRVGLLDDPDNEISREATVDIDFFSTTYSRGKAVSERIRGILRDERRIGGVIVDRRITKSGPREVPWDENSKLRRFLATYALTTRR